MPPWPARLATTPLPVDAVPGRVTGKVAQVIGSEVEVRGLRLRVGQAVTVHAGGPPCWRASRPAQAEVVALSRDRCDARCCSARPTASPVATPWPCAPGDLGCLVGPGLVGRTIDAHRPPDGRRSAAGGQLAGQLEHVGLDLAAPAPLSRRRNRHPAAHRRAGDRRARAAGGGAAHRDLRRFRDRQVDAARACVREGRSRTSTSSH